MNTEIKLPHGQLPGSLELAYMGDAIYEFYVRRRLLIAGGRIKDMHRSAISQVCASAQSRALEKVEGMLTEAEAGVVRRARNAKQTPPKNADPAEYHRATAFEALLGYLYLTNQHERLEEMLTTANP